MRLVSYRRDGVESFGAVTGDHLVDLGGGRTRYTGVREVLAAGALDEIAEIASRGPGDVALASIEYLPPIRDAGKIGGVGLNYKSHAAEVGRDATEHPSTFLRYADSVTGHEQPLVKPRGLGHFDYEGEVGVVIGKPAWRVAAAEALGFVAGYTCFNEGSVRDYQRHTTQWTPGKNFPKSGSFGPWLVTKDEVPDPTKLTLVTRVNGEERQRATTDLLVYSIETIIAYVSSFTPLAPGDVIATGTPGGVGSRRTPPVWLTRGDVVEVEVSGIGTLRNTVEDEA
jgi:2-keto-4-pentenoate hydratase/2-oxohepta-3-ene-1,7-dioic acid hydratase in catechol pathway